MNKKFNVLGYCKINEHKQLVISENDSDELVVATRAVIDDNGKETYYFDKNVIRIKDEHKEAFFDLIEKIR